MFIVLIVLEIIHHIYLNVETLFLILLLIIMQNKILKSSIRFCVKLSCKR
jgi:hypothetical protein